MQRDSGGQNLALSEPVSRIDDDLIGEIAMVMVQEFGETGRSVRIKHQQIVPAPSEVFGEFRELLRQEVLLGTEGDKHPGIVGYAACKQGHVVDLVVVLFEQRAKLRKPRVAIGVEQVALAVAYS